MAAAFRSKPEWPLPPRQNRSGPLRPIGNLPETYPNPRTGPSLKEICRAAGPGGLRSQFNTPRAPAPSAARGRSVVALGPDLVTSAPAPGQEATCLRTAACCLKASLSPIGAAILKGPSAIGPPGPNAMALPIPSVCCAQPLTQERGHRWQRPALGPLLIESLDELAINQSLKLAPA